MYIVTGTPGTGKTTFAKNFAKEKHIKYLSGNDLIKEFDLIETIDEKRKVNVIDENKFATVCEKIIKELNQNKEEAIFDSHLSHFIDPKLIDVCFVTHCKIEELNKRLKNRNYSEDKIKENIESEIFKICEIEAKEFGHNIKIINTD